MKANDVLGRRFGTLVVSSRSSRTSEAGALWECACDCGGATTTTSYKLKTGHTTSCGCARIGTPRHGMSKTRTYKSWKEMRRRCTNPNATQYKWYGGRGVVVCPEWELFETFLADMGERPANTSIDRIGGAMVYSKETCRWATPKQQAESNAGLFKKQRLESFR